MCCWENTKNMTHHHILLIQTFPYTYFGFLFSLSNTFSLCKPWKALKICLMCYTFYWYKNVLIYLLQLFLFNNPSSLCNGEKTLKICFLCKFYCTGCLKIYPLNKNDVFTIYELFYLCSINKICIWSRFLMFLLMKICCWIKIIINFDT